MHFQTVQMFRFELMECEKNRWQAGRQAGKQASIDWTNPIYIVISWRLFKRLSMEKTPKNAHVCQTYKMGGFFSTVDTWCALQIGFALKLPDLKTVTACCSCYFFSDSFKWKINNVSKCWLVDRDNIHSARWLLSQFFFPYLFCCSFVCMLNAFLKNVEHSLFCYFVSFFKNYQEHKSKCNLHFNSFLTYKLPFSTDTHKQIKHTQKLVRKSDETKF